MQRLEGRSAATFDDAHGELSCLRFQSDAQRGGRRLARRFARPEQRDERAASFGRDGQAPQLFIARVPEPGDQSVAGTGAQHLLRRPESVAAAGCMHYGKVSEVDADSRQRGGIRQMRRREPYDPLAGRSQASERGQKELQLADSLLQAQDFSERSDRPAPSRQMAVEIGVAGGNRPRARRRRLAAPDWMLLEDFLQGGHTVRIYSTSSQPGSATSF